MTNTMSFLDVMGRFGHVNLLGCFWTLSAFLILAFHYLVTSDFPLVVQAKDLYYYGKLKSKPSPNCKEFILTRLLSAVPKRCFTHFYAAGFIVHSILLSFWVSSYVGLHLDTGIRRLAQWICWPSPSPALERSAYPFLCVFVLEWIQIVRRLYECVKVSHFSAGTMSFIHYFYGLFFYISFGIGLLSSVQVDALEFPDVLTGRELTCLLVGVCLFTTASYFQHQSMLTFAALRSGMKEKSPGSHYIPRGHLFELISCPHYFCEMLIYASFCVVFCGRNSFLLSVTLFVWVTQLLSGILTHEWYIQTFPSYPQHRRAVIPYLL